MDKQIKDQTRPNPEKGNGIDKFSVSLANGVVAGGFLFIAIILAFALLEVDFTDGLDEQIDKINHEMNNFTESAQQQFQALEPELKSTQPLARTRKAQQGMVPFEQVPLIPFDGIVQEVSAMPRRDNQVHIWLDGNAAQKIHVSVGPDWFLRFEGCVMTHNQSISGVGFNFDSNKPVDVIYAKKITINGRTCQLRNDEGFALWSNKLQ